MRLNTFFDKLRIREIIAWCIVALQCIVLSSYIAAPPEFQFGGGNELSGENIEQRSMGRIDTSILKMNNHFQGYYQKRRTSAISSQMNEAFYEAPNVHPNDAGLVSRVWRSNGSPSIHGDLQQGSCWCSFDEWCMCTPSLAIDLIMTSGPDHLWVVRRQDTGLLALMGGFTEVGETSLETVHRELMEEMSIQLAKDQVPQLFGVYNDPLRDARRHTTSVVFIVDIPADAQPKAGDDATNVIRIGFDDVEKNEFFVDHKTIINDYIKMKQRNEGIASGLANIPPVPRNGDGEPFKRAICPMQ